MLFAGRSRADRRELAPELDADLAERLFAAAGDERVDEQPCEGLALIPGNSIVASWGTTE